MNVNNKDSVWHPIPTGIYNMLKVQYFSLHLFFWLSLVPLNGYTVSKYQVMTYNILSDDNLKYGNYDKLPEKIISWDIRKTKIAKIICKSSVDLVFLQETNLSACNYFKNKLTKDGYDGVCGTDLALFYKKNRFTVVGDQNISLKVGKPSHEVRIQDKNNNIKFQLINVHIKWDNKEPKQHFGCQQLNMLKEHLSKYTWENQYVIIAGDFNLPPHHTCLKDISNFFANSLEHDEQASFLGSTGPARIDYIFGSKRLITKTLTSKVEMHHSTLLPNITHPSDHLPIFAELVLNEIKD